MASNLKLTESGLRELKEELEKKKEELRKLGQYKGQAAENEGDVWHDNFAFEQTEIKERILISDIKNMQTQIETAEIIKNTSDSENNTVKVGSKIRVYLEYSEDDSEEDTFILTGGQGTTEGNKVSLNSPIGECILGKEVGFEGYYKVNGNTIKIKILEIL